MSETRVTKMRIESFNNPHYSGSPVSTYTLMFNPETYKSNWNFKFGRQNSLNGKRSVLIFKEEIPGDYFLNFVIDGTGVGAAAAGRDKPVNVEKELEAFYKTTREKLEFKFDKQKYIHLPYCRLAWGPNIYKGVLKSSTVTINLFSPDGQPLRANVEAVFTTNPNHTD